MEPPTPLPLAWHSLCRGELSVRLADSRDTYVLVPGSADSTRALMSIEVAAVRALASGWLAKRVATELEMSPSRLSRVVKSAVAKLGFSSTTEMLGVLGAVVSPQASDGVEPLTVAEREVLGLVQAGLSNREIGARRGTSDRTIANQVASLLRKTGLHSRRALVARLGGSRKLLWGDAALVQVAEDDRAGAAL